MSTDLNFRMTDLEENLSSDDGAAFKAKVLDRLVASGGIVAKKMDAGLPSEDFKNAQLLHQALAAAHEVVSTFPVQEPEQIKS